MLSHHRPAVLRVLASAPRPLEHSCPAGSLHQGREKEERKAGLRGPQQAWVRRRGHGSVLGGPAALRARTGVLWGLCLSLLGARGGLRL